MTRLVLFCLVFVYLVTSCNAFSWLFVFLFVLLFFRPNKLCYVWCFFLCVTMSSFVLPCPFLLEHINKDFHCFEPGFPGNSFSYNKIHTLLSRCIGPDRSQHNYRGRGRGRGHKFMNTGSEAGAGISFFLNTGAGAGAGAESWLL